MDGLMFYWIAWAFWIYLTFFMNKGNPYRLKLSVTLLIMIILANHFVQMGLFVVNLSGLFLLLLSYSALFQNKRKNLFYFLICSIIITIAYVTFHLFEIFDPIWIVFNKDWMIGICISYLAIILQKTFKERVLIMISGTMQGEMLYSIILSQYDFPNEIGSLAYLDVILLTSCLLLGWSCFENLVAHLENHLTKIEKQRSS